MHGKKRTGTTVVTEHAAQAALRRASVRGLAPEEERVLRMRLGAAAPASARLERLAVATDAEIEVLAYEIEAWMQMKRRHVVAPFAAAPTVPASRAAKEKIVRALRRKA